MINLPRGPELLDAARHSLQQEILPALPAECGYTARMIAKAMAIAARELEHGQDTQRDGARRIAAFLDCGAQDMAGGNAEGLLAEHIRNRAIAPGRNADLRALLLALTRAKLAISNPKYLSREQAQEQA